LTYIYYNKDLKKEKNSSLDNKKNGGITIPVNIEQFADFSAAIIWRLPQALQGANNDSIQHLIENPDDLQALLGNAILAYRRPSNFFAVDIDYGQSIPEKIEQTGYSLAIDLGAWRDSPKNIRKRIEIALIRIRIKNECYAEAAGIVIQLAKMKFRPATLVELLDLAAQHPVTIDCAKIAALGTHGFHEKYQGSSHKIYPFLTREILCEGKKPRVYVGYKDADDMWDKRFYFNEFIFAAVRDRAVPPMNGK